MKSEERIIAINNMLMDSSQPVKAVATDYPSSHLIRWHRHDRAQLVYAIQGALTISTNDGVWVVPPQRAVWVPAHQPHQVETSDSTFIRSLFIAKEVNTSLPDQCIVISMTPLMKELLMTIHNFGDSYDENGSEGRLVKVMIDQLAPIQCESLHWPHTQEPRLQKILTSFHHSPSDTHDLQGWAHQMGMSTRSLSRLFTDKLGMSFIRCRQQIRLLTAVRHLAEGHSVSRASMDAGFRSQSSFTTLFRKNFGTTPAKYFSQ